MRIEITAGGIFGRDGEIPVGTELTVKEEPKGWAGRYRVISGGEAKGKEADTGLKAVHHGGGKFNVVEGDTVHLQGLSKADADLFNTLDDETKRAFIAERKGGE